MTTEHEIGGFGTDRLLMAFALGALTGAAVALLMAPAPGRDTRQTIGRTARTARDGATRAFEQGRSALKTGTGRITGFVGRRRQNGSGAETPSPTAETGASLGPDLDSGL
jgi:gas vesicle protein